MDLDSTTLNLAGGLTTAASGAVLLVVWVQDRREWSALWWALSNALLGCGIILAGFNGALPFLLTNVIGPLFLDLAAPIAFIAASVLEHRSIQPYRMAGLVAAWLGAMALTGILAGESFAAFLGAGTAAWFYAAIARMLWLGRKEELQGRMPLVGIIATYAVALFMLAVQFTLSAGYIPLAITGWLGLIQFIALVYSFGVAVFLTKMLSGRIQTLYRTESLTDSLTGLPNRRAFLDRAQRLLDRLTQDGEFAALLTFDLDRFKTINDTFGHAMGDRVLCIFGDVLCATLRSTDLLARIGGEEFVAMLPSADDEAALAVANRVREAFQKEALFVDGQCLGVTVSIGIAATTCRRRKILDILALADAALYQAKRDGRNRVALAPAPGPAPLATDPARSGSVARIA
jgi:diguanylate cyclase (GGDEF)-like protein